MSEDLSAQRCKACEGGIPPFDEAKIKAWLPKVSGWEHAAGEIVKTFTFKNYYQTMGFVNAVAWIAHQQDHHPDMEVAYKTCRVRYSTHAIGGISENDFICAAKIDKMLE